MSRSGEFLTLDAVSWSALAAIVTVFVYVALLIYAVKQVGEARRLREAQARPFVIVDFEPTSWLLQLVVRNIGQTAAYDVSMTFNPPLDSSLPKPHAWQESSAFTEGIPLLPPHRKIRVAFDSVYGRYEEKSSLPMRYDVALTYRGPDRRAKPHRDHYVLDLNVHRGTRLPEAGIPEIAKAVESIKTAIEASSHRSLRAQASSADFTTLRQPQGGQSRNQVRKAPAKSAGAGPTPVKKAPAAKPSGTKAPARKASAPPEQA